MSSHYSTTESRSLSPSGGKGGGIGGEQLCPLRSALPLHRQRQNSPPKKPAVLELPRRRRLAASPPALGGGWARRRPAAKPLGNRAPRQRTNEQPTKRTQSQRARGNPRATPDSNSGLEFAPCDKLVLSHEGKLYKIEVLLNCVSNWAKFDILYPRWHQR